MIPLEDKVAIITGAAMDMGKVTALNFGKAGAKVAVADINKEEGNKVVDEIKADRGDAIYVR